MRYFYSLQFCQKNTPKSFQEFWKGPYTIVEIISPVCYKIQNNSNPTDIDTVCASRFKKKFEKQKHIATGRKNLGGSWKKMACAKDPFSKVYLKPDG